MRSRRHLATMPQTNRLTIAAEETPATNGWRCPSRRWEHYSRHFELRLLIALPDILVGLRASFLTIMWVLLGYLLITTALVPVIGRLADMFGRKNLYNAGFLVFTLGSLAAGLSQAQFHGVDLLIARIISRASAARYC